MCPHKCINTLFSCMHLMLSHQNIHRHTQTSNMNSHPHSMYTHPQSSQNTSLMYQVLTHILQGTRELHRQNHMHITYICITSDTHTFHFPSNTYMNTHVPHIYMHAHTHLHTHTIHIHTNHKHTHI